MLLPLHDRNPLRIVAFQLVTVSIIVVCVLVHVLVATLADAEEQAAMMGYGFIPALVFDQRELAPELVRLPAMLTPVTSLFLHGSWMHLIGNMLFLWVFGDNIEDATGHLRFVVFFLICGIVAAIAHGLAEPTSVSPLIGASGAVAGVMGAYLVLHPRVKVLVLLFSRVPLSLPAYAVLALWLGFQIYNVHIASDGGVAWWAHIAGFIAGALLIVPMRDPRVPLFDRGVEH